MIIKHASLLGILLFLIACSTTKKAGSLKPDSYVKWCSSAEFQWKNKDTLDGIIYSVRFVPRQYNIAKCALDHCEKKDVLLEDLKSANSSYSFMLELSCVDFSKDLFSFPSRTGMNANERKLYLNNYIKGDLVGVSAANDTIKCISAIYEASIPMRARVLFDLENTGKAITKIVFKDQMISNQPLEFSIPELTAKKIPDLDLKSYE